VVESVAASGRSLPARGESIAAGGETPAAREVTPGAHGGLIAARGETTPAHGGSLAARGETIAAHGESIAAHEETVPAHGETIPAHVFACKSRTGIGNALAEKGFRVSGSKPAWREGRLEACTTMGVTFPVANLHGEEDSEVEEEEDGWLNLRATALEIRQQ